MVSGHLRRKAAGVSRCSRAADLAGLGRTHRRPCDEGNGYAGFSAGACSRYAPHSGSGFDRGGLYPDGANSVRSSAASSSSSGTGQVMPITAARRTYSPIAVRPIPPRLRAPPARQRILGLSPACAVRCRSPLALEAGPGRGHSGEDIPEVGNLSFTKCDPRHTALALAGAFRRPDPLQAPAARGRHD
jgi:hypothetical protein